MLIVLTPATKSRLTTVQAVRQRLGITEEQANEAEVNRMIDTASRMARDYCGRGFGRQTVKQVEAYERPVRGIVLDLSPATIATVRYGDTDLVEGEYVLDTGANILMRDPSGCPGWWGKVEITYTGGYILPEEENPDLPATVEHAVLLLVGALWSIKGRDALVKSETVEGIGRTDYWVAGANSALPDPNAQQLLDPYRRI